MKGMMMTPWGCGGKGGGCCGMSPWMGGMGMGMGMGWGGGGGQSFCSVHGKKRSYQSLVEDGKGGYKCAPGMRCQMGSKGGASPGGGEGEGFAECSAHGKTRRADSLTDDGAGGMVCIPGSECKVSSKRPGEDMALPDGKRMRMDNGGTGTATCTLHQKVRNVSSLTEDGAGGFVCVPGQECQLPGSNTPETVCSVHGKNRSRSSLIEDGQGGFRCAPGNFCKVGGVRGGGGGGGCWGPMWGGMPPFMMTGFGMGGGYGKGKGRGGGGGTAEGQAICSVHGGKRTMRNLEQDGAGGWRCVPGSQCKTGNGMGMMMGGGLMG